MSSPSQQRPPKSPTPPPPAASPHLPYDCKTTRPTDSLARLFWNLQSPLLSGHAISVMSAPAFNSLSSPRENLPPYYDPATETHHPLAQEPISSPPASSVALQVGELYIWPYDWLESHKEELGAEGPQVWGPGRSFGFEEGEEDDIGDDGEGNILLECCGFKRPPECETLVVKAGEKGFVTVGDYVGVVHPWLLEQRGLLLRACGNFVDGERHLPEEAELYVLANLPDGPGVMEKWEMLKFYKGSNDRVRREVEAGERTAEGARKMKIVHRGGKSKEMA